MHALSFCRKALLFLFILAIFSLPASPVPIPVRPFQQSFFGTLSQTGHPDSHARRRNCLKI